MFQWMKLLGVPILFGLVVDLWLTFWRCGDYMVLMWLQRMLGNEEWYSGA
jgi:hypothetical protein